MFGTGRGASAGAGPGRGWRAQMGLCPCDRREQAGWQGIPGGWQQQTWGPGSWTGKGWGQGPGQAQGKGWGQGWGQGQAQGKGWGQGQGWMGGYPTSSGWWQPTQGGLSKQYPAGQVGVPYGWYPGYGVVQ